MGDVLRPLPGCRVGSWRGVPMHVPDISTPAGRRIVSTELPGIDVTLHEDLGLSTGAIRVTALLAGDDYIAQARAMQDACETRGPGTLVHPWLGEMLVVLKDPADITFRATELRTVQVRLTFERWSGAPVAGLSTLGLIAAAVEGVLAAISALAAVIEDVVDLAEVAGDLFAVVDDAIVDGMLGGDLATIVAEAGLEAAVATIGDAAGFVAWVSSVVDTIAAAGTPAPSPAIGVGPLGRAEEATLDPWSTVAALIAVATASASASLSADDEGGSVVSIVTATAALAAVTDPLAAVDWESRQQALAARATISAAIATVSAALVGATAPTSLSAAARHVTWRRLAELRRTIHQDLDDRIGRLPSVMTIAPPTRVSAWVIAHHLFGDDPSAVRSGFEDIVTRNRLSHPSIVDVDPVEVLPQ